MCCRRLAQAGTRLNDMVAEALLRDAAVPIAWQHQDIPGVNQSILTQTRTPPGTFNVPKTWPTDRRGAARYDGADLDEVRLRIRPASRRRAD
jgi:hypothetical protein